MIRTVFIGLNIVVFCLWCYLQSALTFIGFAGLFVGYILYEISLLNKEIDAITSVDLILPAVRCKFVGLKEMKCAFCEKHCEED